MERCSEGLALLPLCTEDGSWMPTCSGTAMFVWARTVQDAAGSKTSRGSRCIHQLNQNGYGGVIKLNFE